MVDIFLHEMADKITGYWTHFEGDEELEEFYTLTIIITQGDKKHEIDVMLRNMKPIEIEKEIRKEAPSEKEAIPKK